MAEPDGILNDRGLHALLSSGVLTTSAPVDADQVQPASLDLRLADHAYRIRASFLPGPDRTVAQRLADRDLVMHRIDLAGGAVLETGCVYVAPLMESARLTPDLVGLANPKSSTGRIDVFTRLITETARQFDHVPSGYEGPLYLEISPRTFSIIVRPGTRLAQLRVRRGLAPTPLESQVEMFSVDARPETPGAVIGYRARRHAGVIDLDAIGGHDPTRYWEPMVSGRGPLVLDPDEFYILASREPVRIAPDAAAEMVPVAPEIGEFRAHYAGFFDPGFGCAEAGGAGARAVLEVRGRDVPFILEHGQPVARLIHAPLTAAPETLYGAAGSHYQAQGLKLSKHFGDWPA